MPSYSDTYSASARDPHSFWLRASTLLHWDHEPLTAVDDMIRTDISPIAVLEDVIVVAALPKTRSDKILRNTMRSIADGRELVMPATVDDPDVVTALLPLLQNPSRG